MYKFAYSEAIAESSQENRTAEREVLLHSIELMEAAENAGPESREAIEATYFMTRLWCHLIEDLGSPDNALSHALRAKLISIGFFLIKASEEVRSGERRSFRAMIEISNSIADGLKT
ncbi:MAG: flagellar biosynthesis regulator FlaF [Hyphomicrobium sp.]|nr:flagellar biosynthesis regulator FlaF [Hyphomicrobium sp.]